MNQGGEGRRTEANTQKAAPFEIKMGFTHYEEVKTRVR